MGISCGEKGDKRADLERKLLDLRGGYYLIPQA